MYASVPHMMAQLVLKIEKNVPYHGANPNTRNGTRLRSPSLIMAPVHAYYDCILTLGSLWQY